MTLPAYGDIPLANESPWARLARLHGDLSRCYGDIAEQERNRVAAGAQQSDITNVKLLTVSDLAGRFSVTQKTVRRWRREGRLPAAIEIGGVIRWEPGVVEQWLKEQSA